MKIFCIIMLSFFLITAILFTLGFIFEWDGDCSVCNHENGCNVIARARFFSAMTIIILWICSGAWGVLTLQVFDKDKFRGKNGLDG